MKPNRRAITSALACIAGMPLALLPVAYGGHTARDDASENATMKPSTTCLHLLRKTPFFTGLDTRQLRWTIDHSREWEARPGTVIATCAPGATRITRVTRITSVTSVTSGAAGDASGDARNGAPDDAFWILLDGRWQVETDGRQYPSGHADPGKWFCAAAARGPCRLVTTEHSYVMKITRADMDEMLTYRFAFDSHLRDGRVYYEAMFPTPPAVSHEAK